ncbi:ParB/RepB/Spo0J family partition protein [Streptosporangium sp. NPDC049644]|uniref:ParB/RepB/Spo0J family partition protein n=1 Tax=Streptosporangium sp. NPDC049644 TaxID=3155507 RepID=UPI0034454DA4
MKEGITVTLHVAADTDRNDKKHLPEVSDLLRDLPKGVVSMGDLMPSLLPRKQAEDPAHIRRLAETENSTDPIFVHRPTMRVIDGAHRLRVAAMRGVTEITVHFFDGSEADAFVLSVQLNVRHGLPLTLDERKAAAQRIIGSHPRWSDRAIAERTGLSPKTVGKVRSRAGEAASRLDSRLGQDGRARPVSSVEGRYNAAALMATNPEISLRELSRKTGLSVGTVRDVRQRLHHGQNPIPERLRGPEEGAAAVAPPRNGTRSPRGEMKATAVETVSVVQKLVRDPSLRSTESGRTLLRMLLLTEMEQSQWEEIAEAVPIHCVPLIHAVVLKRCEDWKKLASVVSRKSEKAG